MVTETRGATTDKGGQSGGKGRRTSPALFYRQVVAELRKVIWPSRSEMLNYTAVVLVFVLIMVGFVFGFDWLFHEGVVKIFAG